MDAHLPTTFAACLVLETANVRISQIKDVIGQGVVVRMSAFGIQQKSLECLNWRAKLSLVLKTLLCRFETEVVICAQSPAQFSLCILEQGIWDAQVAEKAR
jgi:hypothetical protein